MGPPVSLCHWGAFEATISEGRLVAARPLPGSGADPGMIGALPALVHSPSRIDRPHVRHGYLERGRDAGGAGRGREEMVPVEWDAALDLAAGELRRVHAEHGPQAVFGGSYGWSSAGRFHHARSQLRRFLAAAGGFTDVIGNYSWGAAQAILPHVLGSHAAVSSDATEWRSVIEHADAVVAFGGLNPKNWRVTSGGARAHAIPELISEARGRGVRFAVVSPHAGDAPPGLGALMIRPRPGSDAAIMLGLCHEALRTGRADCGFLDRFTSGAEAFCAHLRGETDGQPRTIGWAARIADVPVAELAALWETIREGRVMLSASWSLQRGEHGEQPYWALIALAAMLGQIGAPGGGFTFGYGSMNGVGAQGRRGLIPSLPGLPNAGGAIPVARLADALETPGVVIDFDGRRVRLPDIRLIWWAGGNPFHHAQDLNRLERLWRRPETIIVHEPWWTPTARRADIVFPATTTLERDDIGGSSRDLTVFAMPRLIAPQGEARDDFAILRGVAERIGCRAAFDEGLDVDGWLRRMWAGAQAQALKAGLHAPDYDALRAAGSWTAPPEPHPEILLADFRADPDAHPLATPTGRIVLSSERIAAFGYQDVPPHPAWLAPAEWLGAAAPDELHLLTNQPARQLHSQLWQTIPHDGPAPVLLSPEDAAARKLGDGDLARLWNARGACLATVRVEAGLRRGVALMETGAWFAPDEEGPERHGNPNVLTADRPTSSLGQACAALSALVRIERARRE